MSPLQSIKNFCAECMGGQQRLVKDCTSKNCALWEYRNGKNPNRKREMTDEQRQAAAERLRKAREAKNAT